MRTFFFFFFCDEEEGASFRYPAECRRSIARCPTSRTEVELIIWLGLSVETPLTEPKSKDGRWVSFESLWTGFAYFILTKVYPWQHNILFVFVGHIKILTKFTLHASESNFC